MSTNTPTLIGLMGRAQAGKDTAARALVEAGWKRVAFADPLRRLAYRTDPIVEALHGGGTAHVRLSWLVDRLGWDQAKQFPDVRRLLQRLGAEGVRTVIGDTTWIDLAAETIRRHREARVPVVVTDVRFSNEVDAVRALDGIVVEIVRPGHTPVASSHSSETEQAAVTPDALIVNDGSAQDLQTRIRVLVGLG